MEIKAKKDRFLLVVVITLIMLGVLLPVTFFMACTPSSTKDNLPDNLLSDGSAIEVSLPVIDMNIPEHTETTTFALGCFWAPDSRFGSIDGVVSTRVGYAGGDSNNPTYHNLDGHSETIQINFDLGMISYQELLDIFWDNHNPTLQAWSKQYRSIIFYHDDEQRELAVGSRQSREVVLGREIFTEVVPFSEFYLAEDYHQKYYLMREEIILQDLRSIYPIIDGFIASTAVARINGYVGGFGDHEILSNELDSLGLSEAGKMALLDIADRGLVSGCAVPESG